MNSRDCPSISNRPVDCLAFGSVHLIWIRLLSGPSWRAQQITSGAKVLSRWTVSPILAIERGSSPSFEVLTESNITKLLDCESHSVTYVFFLVGSDN